MRLWLVLVVLGILVAIFGIINHFTAIVPGAQYHIDYYIVGVGVVIAVIGGILMYMQRPPSEV